MNKLNNCTPIFPTHMKLIFNFRDREAVTSPPQTSTFSYRCVNHDSYTPGESNAHLQVKGGPNFVN